MLIGTTQTINNQNTRVRFYAGTECFPHQQGCPPDPRSLANTACHYPYCRCHYHPLPHLEEAQTR